MIGDYLKEFQIKNVLSLLLQHLQPQIWQRLTSHDHFKISNFNFWDINLIKGTKLKIIICELLKA